MKFFFKSCLWIAYKWNPTGSRPRLESVLLQFTMTTSPILIPEMQKQNFNFLLIYFISISFPTVPISLQFKDSNPYLSNSVSSRNRLFNILLNIIYDIYTIICKTNYEYNFFAYFYLISKRFEKLQIPKHCYYSPYIT